MNPAALARLRALEARARLPDPAGNTAELATDPVELRQAYLEMVRAGPADPELDGLSPTELIDEFRLLIGHKRP